MSPDIVPKGRRPHDENVFLGLSKPAQRALEHAGYIRLEQLTKVRLSELKRLHGMGPKAIGQLNDALAARGLSFADEDEA